MADIPIYNVQITDKQALLSAYMPFVKNGGIFVKSAIHQPGSFVGVLLSIPGESSIYTVTGKVIWLSPKTQMNEGGVGLQFQENSDMLQLKGKIENLLGGLDRTKASTFTV